MSPFLFLPLFFNVLVMVIKTVWHKPSFVSVTGQSLSFWYEYVHLLTSLPQNGQSNPLLNSSWLSVHARTPVQSDTWILEMKASDGDILNCSQKTLGFTKNLTFQLQIKNRTTDLSLLLSDTQNVTTGSNPKPQINLLLE